MKYNNIYIILRAFIDGVIPQKYKRDVECWMTDNSDREAKDAAFEKIWNETPSDFDNTTMQVLERIHNEIDDVDHTRNLILKIMRYAAVIALPIIIGLGVWKYSGDYYYSQTAMTECYASNGDIRDITLSDGTHVKLNSGSTLVYPKSFGRKERNVILYGEAFFSVAKDRSHPFIVHNGDMRIKVLGTKFNVKAYPDADNVTTTLVEGRVQLYSDCVRGNSVVMTPNMEAVYNRRTGRISLSDVDTRENCVWTSGDLNFNDADLASIIYLMERHYDVKFIVSPGVNLNIKYSMNFKSYEKLDKVLHILSDVSGNLSYKKEGRTVKLYRKGGAPQ